MSGLATEGRREGGTAEGGTAHTAAPSAGGAGGPLRGVPSPALVPSSISERSNRPKPSPIPAPTRFEMLPADVRVVRDYGPQAQPEHLKHARRGAVEMFSPRSAARLTRIARNAYPALISQFCLTYHEANPDGETAKKHLHAWLAALRRAAPGVGYLWILEFQSRGVPHFHVWLTVPFSVDLWKRLGKAWNRVAEPESPEHLWWHTEERFDRRKGLQRSFMPWEMNGAGYLRKYMSKEAQKCVPEGFGWVGRFWGCTRALVPDPVEFDADDLPADVQDVTRTLSKWVEARRRRGAALARKIAHEKGREPQPVHLRPTARAVRSSAWLNNATPALLQLLDHLSILSFGADPPNREGGCITSA